MNLIDSFKNRSDIKKKKRAKYTKVDQDKLSGLKR